MAQYENNAFFWQKIDTLFLSSKLVITRKKDDIHPKFPNLIYPTDYGYLKETISTSGEGTSVYAGSLSRNKISGLIIAVDILQKELDVKILAGCTEEEIVDVLHFLNQTDYQKTVLIRRGMDMPSWGLSEN